MKHKKTSVESFLKRRVTGIALGMWQPLISEQVGATEGRPSLQPQAPSHLPMSMLSPQLVPGWEDKIKAGSKSQELCTPSHRDQSAPQPPSVTKQLPIQLSTIVIDINTANNSRMFAMLGQALPQIILGTWRGWGHRETRDCLGQGHGDEVGKDVVCPC